MRRALRLLGLLLSLAAGAASAAVTAGARVAPQSVAVGEPADLAVVVQGTQQAGAPAVPAVDGLRVDYVGPETQVAIVNGQVTASVTHHFTLVPQREGTFTVGPITVEAEGRALSAGVVTLRAVSGTAGAPAPDTGLAVVLSAPRTTVYLNERLPVSVLLRVGGVQVTDVNYPRILGDGFALEPFAEPAQRQDQDVTVVDFRTAVTPARAGSLTLGPAVLALAVLRQRQQRRTFFGGSVRQQIELRSDALALEVLPLPPEGRPPDFAGAVGRFAVTATAAPTELRVGDPVTLTMSVQGEGTLAGATPAGVASSEAFRVYPVQAAARQPESGGGVVHRLFEQVVIPQRAGPVAIPPLRFAFFDPEARAYRTVVQPAIALEVREAPERAGSPQIVGGPAPAQPEAPGPLGRDIVSIKDAPGAWQPVGAARWRSAGFWLLQLVPLALLAGVAAWDRRRRRLGGDPRLVRFGRAGRAAREGLGAARAALAAGDRPGCYDGVSRTISAYLAAKLDLAPGSVTVERAAERLHAAGVADGIVEDLRVLSAACEQARFAPRGMADGDAERTIARAEAVVRACERERRLARSLGVAATVALTALLAGALTVAAADSPGALFYRGNALYGDGRFADAAAAYLAARAQGETSAALEYNLGNAWLKAGDVGRAVLAYERARRLAPRDPDLAANLGFARPAGSEPVVAWWERLLFPLAAGWTGEALVHAGAGAWWACCLLLVLARLVPGAARPARALAVAAGLVLLLVGTSAAWRLVTLELRAAAVVVSPQAVTVRFEPTPSGTAHFEAQPGTVLALLGERGEWVQVERGDGLRGWVERTAVEPV